MSPLPLQAQLLALAQIIMTARLPLLGTSAKILSLLPLERMQALHLRLRLHLLPLTLLLVDRCLFLLHRHLRQDRHKPTDDLSSSSSLVSFMHILSTAC